MRNTFNKALVALDGSSQDCQLMKYTWFLLNKFDFEVIHFLQVLPGSPPKKISTDDLDNLLAEQEILKKETCQHLAKEIQPFFDYKKSLKITLNVKSGDPQYLIEEIAKKEEIDLLVLGKKKLTEGSGVIARRIAQKINAAVWFVTDNATTNIKQILVPFDFSECSKRAHQFALEISKLFKSVNIVVLHLIDLPVAAISIHKNEEELVKLMRIEGRKEYTDYLKTQELNPKDFLFNIGLNREFNATKYIREMARDQTVDLIIMGARGHSCLNDYVLGSTAEKMATLEEDIPILILR